ncbi:MAG: isoaspartyl peptidase/L-asparaginase family protein [Steroidobacteraceae bacterium]
MNALTGPTDRPGAPVRWALAIHGGAGTQPRRAQVEEVTALGEALTRALDAGIQLLSAGGRALDAVQSAVRVMEGSGVLNAGRGAVLNHEGFAELDAALMDGQGRRAGAVAAVRHIAHPIDLARAVLDHGRHVLLVGEGARQFAVERGFTLEPDEYFVTPRRLAELERMRAVRGGAPGPDSWHPGGTVGAVALDARGDLAAATSTGGLTDKHVGRVGDSPIIGAGTFAENGVCAVSGTGAGEYFMRFTAASEVAARVKLQRASVEDAAREVIGMMKAAGGEGGLIAVDARGHITMPYSSQAMLRACARADGSRMIPQEG